jgi:lectin-like protein
MLSRRLTISSLVAFALSLGPLHAHAASTYTLTQPGTWFQAEAEANSLGGHLVAINSAAEEQELLTLFGGTEPFWIGLTDQQVEGVFVWTDGEPLTYSNWAPGEPNNENNEDYVNTNDFRGPGLWNDGHADTRSFRGIVEIAPEPALAGLVWAALLGLGFARKRRRG